MSGLVKESKRPESYGAQDRNAFPLHLLLHTLECKLDGNLWCVEVSGINLHVLQASNTAQQADVPPMGSPKSTNSDDPQRAEIRASHQPVESVSVFWIIVVHVPDKCDFSQATTPLCADIAEEFGE